MMQNTKSHIQKIQGPILVLGASGFIGANLYRMIHEVRHDVYAVVHSDKSWRLADIPDDKIITVDLTDASSTKNLIDTINPKSVFDCVAYGAYSFEEDTRKIYKTNFDALVGLVELLQRKKISAYVHAGSSSEYGTNASAPSEDAPCEPNSHYAVSKVASETFLRFVGKQRGFPCIHLRLYSIYGPLEDTSRLIPNVLKCAISGTLPPFVDKDTSRDFLHVEDACCAFIIAAAKMNPDLYGETFNIGSGVKTTIGELANTIANLFKINETPVFGSMKGRTWDMCDWYANPAKAETVLGWKPSIALENGLLSMSKWIQGLTEESFVHGTKMNLKIRDRSVSAIVACYKDADAIPIMHKRLVDTFTKLKIDYEIIFVNDASPDETIGVIKDISSQDPHVIGISHSRNFGSQMAFRSGMELASKNSVVLLDGDLQDPPELIEDFHKKWEDGYDVVYGRRIKREMPWYWGLMYKGFYRVFAAFSYIPIPKDAGDFSLIDRRVVGWMLQCGERDLFMRGLRAYVGFRQTGVDYVRPERMFGRSTNNLWKNIDWAKKGIFSFSNEPLAILTSTGLFLFLLSILLSAIAVVLKLFWPDIAPKGATTILIAVLLLGSLNLFSIGLIGEYIGKIMLEVKARPRLIRTGIIRFGSFTDLLPDGKVGS